MFGNFQISFIFVDGNERIVLSGDGTRALISGVLQPYMTRQDSPFNALRMFGLFLFKSLCLATFLEGMQTPLKRKIPYPLQALNHLQNVIGLQIGETQGFTPPHRPVAPLVYHSPHCVTKGCNFYGPPCHTRL